MIYTAAIVSLVSIKIQASKTDPFREGVTMYLGKAESNLCPVGALLGYIAHQALFDGLFFIFYKNV